MGVAVNRDAIPVDLPLLLQVQRGADAKALIEERISVVDTPAEVAEKCDILTIHLAANPITKGIVNAEVLGKLKPGAYVVNTARADVLDYKALAAAVKEKGIRVGLDVYPAEPAGATAEFATPILGLPGVYGTHHIGASTDQAQEAIAGETVRIVKTFKETGRVPNVVNLAKKTPAAYSLIIRHKDQPGVLACVFSKLASVGINAHETENIVFEAAEAAIVESMRKECPAILEVNIVALGEVVNV
jgi:D-3-phosphoglycerate dehydrogenase